MYQNIRDTAQAAFDSRFLPRRCRNVASPRRVGEPHVQIANGMAYAVLGKSLNAKTLGV